jgi:hypothetical protein
LAGTDVVVDVDRGRRAVALPTMGPIAAQPEESKARPNKANNILSQDRRRNEVGRGMNVSYSHAAFPNKRGQIYCMHFHWLTREEMLHRENLSFNELTLARAKGILSLLRQGRVILTMC